MKTIVGLGNPGKEYELTRHNFGFLFIDYLYENLEEKGTWRSEKKWKADVVDVLASTMFLVKPQTFMNFSGEAVSKILKFYKCSPNEDLIVVHDDLDIPFGQWKIQKGKGPKIHNGLNSIINHIKNDEFWRIRIGIAGNEYEIVKKQTESVAKDYILKPFSNQEQQQLLAIFSGICNECKLLRLL